MRKRGVDPGSCKPKFVTGGKIDNSEQISWFEVAGEVQEMNEGWHGEEWQTRLQREILVPDFFIYFISRNCGYFII